MLAQAQLSRGHPSAAMARLASAEPCDAGASLELRAVYAAHPFVQTSRPRLRHLLMALRTWQPGAAPGGGYEDSKENISAQVRRYGMGLVALRLGDTVQAHRASVALSRLSDRTFVGDLGWSLSRSLRARLALKQGRPALALAALEEARWERAAGRSVAEVSDRFLRAELLRQLGRTEEAIGWYGAIAQRSSYELVYLAPAQFRLGQIYDQRGDSEKAISHYRRFRELWQTPDAELRWMVIQASRRLEALAPGARDGGVR
jgi:tetratricopeptide (TPR) repeat protein